MNLIVGTHDILFITLDTLRYDVAEQELAAGRLPNLAALLPGGSWDKCHSPGNFTYSAHTAFFAGFLPTPAKPGRHSRLFAADFEGSETSTTRTCRFESPDIVTGLASKGYHTICIGGVGFFNKLTPLGSVLPGLFAESLWSPALGVADPDSTRNQVAAALDSINTLDRVNPGKRAFLFINVSALHQPNYFYLRENKGDNHSKTDSILSHAAALRYVDSQLPPLFKAMQKRAPLFVIICSDHGTAYGEEGYVGHRLGHEVVWIVPYKDFVLSAHFGSAQ
ncbi:MAG: sulfatase-like hydrolase/transferase [bacterium]|nr:sulfatase-like hydrolase/transferase [bacterium]